MLFVAASDAISHPRFRALPHHLLARDSERWAAAHYLFEGSALPLFLRSIAAGDLCRATALRPSVDLRPYLDFFDAMPSPSRGSYARVCEWEMVGGLKGIHHLNECIGRAYE